MRHMTNLAAALTIAAPLSSQRLAAELPTYQPPAAFLQPSLRPQRLAVQPQPPVGLPILGGLAGGALGLAGGFVVGMEVGGGSHICGDDPCGFAGAITGALLGEMLLLPVGVHVGNGRRGNFAGALGASVGVGLATLVLAGDLDRGELLALGVVGQLAASVVVERGGVRRAQ